MPCRDMLGLPFGCKRSIDSINGPLNFGDLFGDLFNLFVAVKDPFLGYLPSSVHKVDVHP